MTTTTSTCTTKRTTTTMKTTSSLCCYISSDGRQSSLLLLRMLLLIAVVLATNTLWVVHSYSLVLPSSHHILHNNNNRHHRNCAAIVNPAIAAPATTTTTTTTIRKRRRKEQNYWSSHPYSCSALSSVSTTAAASPSEDIASTVTNGLKKNNNDIDNNNDDNNVSSSKFKRFKQALPFKKDPLDEIILKTAVPTVMNLMVVPLVNAVDTFWVGRLGLAVALAAQSAANQACFTLFFLIAFLPNMTAPLVAEAVSSGDKELARKRVCESLFLCNILGTIGTLTLTLFPRQILTALLLPADSPVLQYAAPYLRWRALGMVPSLIAATGSASYRGLLNTVTPLKVSLMTNGVNLILDPLLMFGTKGLVSSGGTKGLGFVGAAVATAVSETLGGMTYIHLLLRRKLATWSMLLKPPPLKSLLPLLSGGAALFLRYLALNIGFLVATRRAQLLDPSGVSGAAYGITMQIYSVGIIALIGMQNAAAALVPSFRGAAKKSKSSGTSDDLDDDEINKAAAIADDKARECADRLFGWSTLVGLTLGIGQVALLPVLVPLFSTLPNVQEAVKIPSLIAALIHVVNGPVLAGEGVMMGVGAYKDLALVTMGYIISMIGCLSFTPLGKRLDGIMWSILISSIVQQIGVVGHYLKVGPLARKNIKKTSKG